MEATWKTRVSTFLTAAYMISAGVVSIATSKAPDGSYGGLTYAQANYSVQSNCNAAAANSVDAFHVQNGLITSSLDYDGVVRTTTMTDFTQIGFPHTHLIVGTDVINGTRKCTVRSKLTQANVQPSAEDQNYSFIQPGYLTTVNYDCYESTAYRCSISLKELPAGALESVY